LKYKAKNNEMTMTEKCVCNNLKIK